MFLGISTILPEPSIVGKFGAGMGLWNQQWFGYFSFVYPFVLLLPSFIFYKESAFTERRIGVILSSLILFSALLMSHETVLNEEESEETAPKIKSKNTKKVEILSVVEENKQLLSQIERGERDKPKDFKLPPLSFLANPPNKAVHVNESEIDQKIQDLLEKLRRFKIEG
ncbi:MAG: cell division protein FtsK, partial [Sulfurovum sp. FS06-10]